MTIKSAEKKTLGGKVVQILGVDISDITVSGTFGGWEEQHRFLNRMKRIADRQVSGYIRSSQKNIQGGAAPVRFMFPPRGWDFKVYLKAFTQTGSQQSVSMDINTFAPKWTLILWVVEDHTSGKLTTASKNAIIARLSAGMGWKQTRYNGPMGFEGVQRVVGASAGEYFDSRANPGG
jgi:hypothetical protein